MADTLERFGKNADYIVVKNYGKGKDFSIYENSGRRKILLNEYHGQEILLKPLLERTVVLLDDHDIGFSASLRHELVPSAARARVRGFLAQAYGEFGTVQPRLVP